MKGLTDIPGIQVGHISDYDAITGCTAILCEQGAVGGVDIRGSASGTQEIDTLSPFHVGDQVHAILLAGGSAFGLEAAAGVQTHVQRGVERLVRVQGDPAASPTAFQKMGFFGFALNVQLRINSP